MVCESECQPKEAEKRQPPPRRSVLVRIFRALKRHEDRRRRRHKKEASETDIAMARWTRRVGLFTLALVVVSIITAFIFYDQLVAMRKDGRPWVGLSGINPLNTQQVFFIISNSGKSPALHVTAKIEGTILSNDGQPLDMSACQNDCFLDDVEMLPNVPMGRKIPPAPVPAGAEFRMFARIDYEDSDGGSHHTRICLIDKYPFLDMRSCPEPNSNYAD